MNKQRFELGEEPPLEGRLLTIHNETVKLGANHIDRLASSVQTAFIVGGLIKAIGKDADKSDMVIAVAMIIVGVTAAKKLHEYAKNKLGEMQ